MTVLLGARWLVQRRPVAATSGAPGGYVPDVATLRAEYGHYYGRPIAESAIETRFQEAAGLLGDRNYPGAASVLESLSKTAGVPVVFSDLGVVYSSLGDYGRAADSFREALARDAEYSPARRFLSTSRSIPPNTADPYTREVEPNNESGTANLIALGAPAGGEVTASTDDIDYFRIVTPAAPRDVLTVDLANHSINFAPRLHVYDADLRLLSWGEKIADAGDSIHVSGGPAPNSPLYISISASGGNGGLYVLTVTPRKAFDNYEPNDDILSSRRISLGDDIQANIMDAADTDFYSFQSPRKGTVSIEIRNRSETLIPAVTTYNPDRRNMGFGPEIRQPGLSLHHTIDVEKGQIYYIQVWSQANSSGAYTLRLD